MNAIWRVRLFFAAFAWAACVLPQCFGEAKVAEAGGDVSWDSPRMRDIRKDWDALGALGSASKDSSARATNLVGELLRRRLCDDDLRRLAATCGSLPARSEDRSDFDNCLLAFIVKVFVHSGDWDRLTKLLSTRCPRYVAMHEYIEEYLALHGGKGMRPILLLGDAYSKCRDRDVRHELAGAVRRGFAGLGIRAEDDSEYVRKAMQWYENEKGNLAVNSDYCVNASRHEPEFYDNPAGYDTGMLGHQFLFAKKASQASPGPGQGAREAAGGVANQAGAPAWPASASGPAAEKPADKLEGTWQETGIQYNGATEAPSGLRLVVHKGLVEWIPADRRNFQDRSFSLGFLQDPRAIDLLETSWFNMGITISAIYEVHGDRLRICFPDVSEPWLRPTSFAAEEGSCETLRTFKRLKD